MTDRQRYLSGEISHEDYYLAIARELKPHFTGEFISRCRKALDAGDEHLNTIPLSTWDRLGGTIGAWYKPRKMLGGPPGLAGPRRKSHPLQQAALKRGDQVSAAMVVCILKAAARAMARGEW